MPRWLVGTLLFGASARVHAAAGYTRIDATCWTEGYVQRLEGKTSEECAAACDANSACKGFTYSSRGVRDECDYCQLESRTVFAPCDAGDYIFYRKDVACGTDKAAISGAIVNSSVLSARNSGDCRARCSALDTCTHWDYGVYKDYRRYSMKGDCNLRSSSGTGEREGFIQPGPGYGDAYGEKNCIFEEYTCDMYTCEAGMKKESPDTIRGVTDAECCHRPVVFEAAGYTRVVQVCVTGHDIETTLWKSVPECAALCNARSDCLGFEYGMDYGGYAVRFGACTLQSSDDTAGCGGADHNVDFYARDLDNRASPADVENDSTGITTALIATGVFVSSVLLGVLFGCRRAHMIKSRQVLELAHIEQGRQIQLTKQADATRRDMQRMRRDLEVQERNIRAPVEVTLTVADPVPAFPALHYVPVIATAADPVPAFGTNTEPPPSDADSGLPSSSAPSASLGFCAKCGTGRTAGGAFCVKCGCPLPEL